MRRPCTERPDSKRGGSAGGAANVAAAASAASTRVAWHSVKTVIVGAGTFGASLAWTLARAGEEVVLVDQFEPGDTRATSGGESRLIRCAHGGDELYTASARRARALWRELEAETGDELMVEIGMAWFAQREDGWEAESERAMAAQGIPCERLDPGEGAKLFPSLGTGDLTFVPGEEDRIDVGEVLVQRCAADTRVRCDLGHRHRTQATLGDQRRRRVQRRVAYVLAVRFHGFVPQPGHELQAYAAPRIETARSCSRHSVL